MTKQSSHPQRLHRGSLWIAMLATLAFAGAGQALAPAPAAALHIDACAQPDSGLCDAADEGPTSGDSSSATSKGGGGSGSSASAPDPGLAAWNQREPNGVPTWFFDAKVRDLALGHHCEVISARWLKVDKELDALGSDLPSTPEIFRQMGVSAEAYERKLRKQLGRLNSQWDSYDCTDRAFAAMGL